MQPRNSKQVPKVNQTKDSSNPREKEICSHGCRELRPFLNKILCTNLSQTQTEPGRQNHQSFLLLFKCKSLGFKHKNLETNMQTFGENFSCIFWVFHQTYNGASQIPVKTRNLLHLTLKPDIQTNNKDRKSSDQQKLEQKITFD